jgi:hypothetical protein
VCGIAGFAGAGTRDDLRAMGDAIRHRGPDGEGIHVDERHHVHLVHRRLAILDIAGGDQPMWNEDRTVCVIFNGEIYNHLELRAMLAARGHSFRSDHSDTEVLVHGYEEWGEELPARLNGMFAFAVWDSVRARLFLARDRFGKKPLYYCSEPGFFAFASELTALQRHPSVPCDVDRRSLQKLLAYGFVPAPRSLYRAIERLPGGCQVMVDVARPHAATARRYWQFAIDAPASIPRNPERAWGEELRALLSQAVRRRLMSDVPLGCSSPGASIRPPCSLTHARTCRRGRCIPTRSDSTKRRSTSPPMPARWRRSSEPRTMKRSSTSSARAPSPRRCSGASTSRSPIRRSCPRSCYAASRGRRSPWRWAATAATSSSRATIRSALSRSRAGTTRSCPRG